MAELAKPDSTPSLKNESLSLSELPDRRFFLKVAALTALSAPQLIGCSPDRNTSKSKKRQTGDEAAAPLSLQERVDAVASAIEAKGLGKVRAINPDVPLNDPFFLVPYSHLTRGEAYYISDQAVLSLKNECLVVSELARAGFSSVATESSPTYHRYEGIQIHTPRDQRAMNPGDFLVRPPGGPHIPQDVYRKNSPEEVRERFESTEQFKRLLYFTRDSLKVDSPFQEILVAMCPEGAVIRGIEDPELFDDLVEWYVKEVQPQQRFRNTLLHCFHTGGEIIYPTGESKHEGSIRVTWKHSVKGSFETSQYSVEEFRRGLEDFLNPMEAAHPIQKQREKFVIDDPASVKLFGRDHLPSLETFTTTRSMFVVDVSGAQKDFSIMKQCVPLAEKELLKFKEHFSEK